MAKETVTSLVEQVAAGTLDASTAGQRMRPLISTRADPKTLAARIARFNNGGYEEDPNAFVHVEAMYSFGKINAAQYRAIFDAVK